MSKRSLVACILLVLFVVSLPLTLTAKTYVGVDQAGNTRQTKNRPRDHQVVKWLSQPAVQKKKTTAKVDLYVTSWCPYCHKAADYFRARKIPFTVYDIEKDTKAAARKKRLDGGRTGVPFAVVNGVALHGYDPRGYERALAR
ncbi:MAG: glutaredoxin domain-containing protein [Spirochaetales bacterium]|jgi:glutaredoxin|nr:glutaredoxin domain-containing protein [Spirochaetales bacterium]